MNKFQQICFGLLFLVTLIPIIHSNDYDFGMSVPRQLFFWAFIASVIIIGLTLSWKAKKISFKYSLITISLFLYLIILIISGLMAQSSYLSFFSNFERMDGVINFTFLFFFFLIYSNFEFNDIQWTRIGKFSTIIAGVISLITIYQYFKYPLIRATGTLGNPLILGFYLEIHIFLALIFLIKLFEIKNNIFKILLVSFFIITFVFAIFCTGSRSPFISLFLGLLVFLVSILLVKKTIRKYAFYISVSFIIVAYCGIKLSNNINLINRITDYSITDTSSLSRIGLWKTSLKHISDNPFLGCGKENFIYFFAKYYDNSFVNSGDWYDRSHNFLIDKIIETGVIGFLSYLLFISSIVYFLLKSNIDFITKAGLGGLFTAYFIYHFFNFENSVSNLFLFIIAAYVFQRSDKKHIWELKTNRIVKILIASGILVLGYLTIYKTYKTFVALNTLKKQPLESINLDNNLNEALIGQLDYGLMLGLKRLEPTQNIEIKTNFIVQAIKDFKYLLKKFPNHPILLSQLGFLQMDNKQPEEAINTYKLLKTIAPFRHINLMDLGMFYLRDNQFDKALAEFDNISKMDYNYALAKINTAYCYSIQNQFEKSNKILDKLSILELINNLDKCTELYRINNNYNGLLSKISIKNKDKSPDFTPNTFLRWLQIAIIQKNNIEIRKSIETYLDYFYIEHDKKEIQELILNIQEGKLNSEDFYRKFESIWW